MSELAVNGGKKTVTLDTSDQWKRPVEKQKEAVCGLIEEGFISGSGKGLPKKFEDEFRDFIGCKYVLSTSHGHLALASAFFAAGLGAGDEFITPCIGYLGSYAGALHMGARPVFCEPDPETLLADPEDIEKRITDKTRIISPIHWNGRVCNMDVLLDICEKRNIILVEDAAHAHGSSWKGKKIGSFGHIACFSLQGICPGGKPVTSGEGGIVATNDTELYERALVYCHLHRSGALDELTNPVYKELDAQLLGWKWRLHPLEAALGRISLRNLPDRIEKFSSIRDELFDKIADVPGIKPALNYPESEGAELYGGFAFVYDRDELSGLEPELFAEALKAEGVPIMHHAFRQPEHLRSIFTKELPGLWGRGHAGPANIPLPRYYKGDYPVSEYMHENTLRMAGWIEPAEGLIDQVAEAFHRVAENCRTLQPA